MPAHDIVVYTYLDASFDSCSQASEASGEEVFNDVHHSLSVVVRHRGHSHLLIRL